jgi:DeoR family transcriptional regulator, glycerol-3-phosphate regulon repressor
MSRHEHYILSTVNIRGTVKVAELAQILDVSDQTIRRIVKPMEARG